MPCKSRGIYQERVDMDAKLNVWDSPVGGDYLIWRFTLGFSKVNAGGPNLLLAYPAVAMLLDRNFSQDILIASNLADYAFGFQDSVGKKARSLGGLTDRINEYRELTLRSIEFALVTRLIELNPDKGTLSPILRDENNGSAKIAKTFKQEDGRKAEHLGSVFARTNEKYIGYYLGVKF